MLGAGGRSPACCGMPGPALLFSHLLWAPAPGGRRSQWNLGLRKRGGGGGTGDSRAQPGQGSGRRGRAGSLPSTPDEGAWLT